jgi:acid phosphatase class B
MNLKISFDFDGTLDSYPMQVHAAHMLKAGHDVYVVTARTSHINHRGVTDAKTINQDLWRIVDRLGIKESNVHFTEGADKWQMLGALGMDIHYDDMEEEVNGINETGVCLGIKVKP